MNGRGAGLNFIPTDCILSMPCWGPHLVTAQSCDPRFMGSCRDSLRLMWLPWTGAPKRTGRESSRRSVLSACRCNFIRNEEKLSCRSLDLNKKSFAAVCLYYLGCSCLNEAVVWTYNLVFLLFTVMYFVPFLRKRVNQAASSPTLSPYKCCGLARVS